MFISEGQFEFINHMSYFTYVLGKTVAQVALRWLVQQKVVSSVIIGATSVQQLEDNMGASAGWALTDEEVKHILFKYNIQRLKTEFV